MLELIIILLIALVGLTFLSTLMRLIGGCFDSMSNDHRNATLRRIERNTRPDAQLSRKAVAPTMSKEEALRQIDLKYTEGEISKSDRDRAKRKLAR